MIDMGRQRRRRCYALAQVSLSIVALLAQESLLPLAHASHHLSAAVLATSAHSGGRSVTAEIRIANASSAHDSASCLLCNALAHGRTGVLAVMLSAPLCQAGFGAATDPSGRWIDAPAHSAARPRAPPSRTA
jgi:hypothetical protein